MKFETMTKIINDEAETWFSILYEEKSIFVFNLYNSLSPSGEKR